jgi:glutamate racemase
VTAFRNPNSPIGIFDSGVGGLTLLKGIKSTLPNENLIYLGDTARVPYGTKSPKVIQKFSLQIAAFLEKQGVKTIVVACHTASSTALNQLKAKIQIPVVGVIEPAAKKAIDTTKNKKIGIIGTKTTIDSESYQALIKKIAPSISVTTVSAPLLVPLVEEGWLTKEITESVLREYVTPLQKRQIDTLILGCTHYPLLKPLFTKVLGTSVAIIDTSIETAAYLKNLLKKESLLNTSSQPPQDHFYVSDAPEKFSKSAELFLGQKLKTVELINLEES